MRCNHISCGSTEKVWLLHTYRDRQCGLKPHSYCVKCGVVKSASSEKRRNLGYYINVVAALGREFKITKVQMRLVSQEFERCGLDDVYGMDRYTQETLFLEIVRKYIKISEGAVCAFLETQKSI